MKISTGFFAFALFVSSSFVAAQDPSSSVDELGRKKKIIKPKKSGVEMVEVIAVIEEEPEEVTQEQLDFMLSVLQQTFEDLSDGMFTGTPYLDYIEVEKKRRFGVADEKTVDKGSLSLRGNDNDNKTNNLKYWWTTLPYYTNMYVITYDCRLCMDDDAFLSEEEVEISLEASRRTLKLWGDRVCAAYQNSPFEKLRTAKDCKVKLPKGGVALGGEEDDYDVRSNALAAILAQKE